MWRLLLVLCLLFVSVSARAVYIVTQGQAPTGSTATLTAAATSATDPNCGPIGPCNITGVSTATLTWGSTNAGSCTGTGFTVPGSASAGNTTVAPTNSNLYTTTSTTYSVTCGSATASATVVTLPAGFFLSPSGSGTACTFASPCGTISQCKTNVDGSSTAKVCYFRSGSYSFSTRILPSSNEYYSAYPPDGIASASISASGVTTNDAFEIGSGVTNVAFYGLNFTAGPSVAGATSLATLFLVNRANTVYLDENSFNYPTIIIQYLIFYDSTNFYFRGNTMTQTVRGQSPNPGGCGVSPYYCNNVTFTFDDGATHTNILVTNNNFNGCINACLEDSGTGTGSVGDNYHIDYNTFQNFQGLNNVCSQVAFAAISHISPGNVNTGYTNNTVWGNQFTVPSNTVNCIWAAEAVGANTTWENNTCSAGIGMCFNNTSSNNQSVGMAILNNTITTGTNGQQGGCGGSSCAYGVANSVNGEWIGANTINGTSVTGCTGTGSPSYCSGGPYTNPGQPTLNTPAAQYAGAWP